MIQTFLKEFTKSGNEYAYIQSAWSQPKSMGNCQRGENMYEAQNRYQT